MNKKLLIAAILVFGLAGIQITAFAEECPGRNQTDEQTNAKFLQEGLVFAEQALDHAKQGHGPETKAATKSASLKFKCIITTTGESQMQKPKEKIKRAGIAAGKGDTAAAIPLLEEGIAILKNMDMTPKGMGD